MPTGSVEREAKRIVDSVCHAFFDVDNLQGIGSLDSSRKKIMISNNRASDITFFSFHSTVLASALAQCFPSTTLSLDFSLRLPQNVTSTASAPAPTLAPSIRTPPGRPDHTMVQNPVSRPTSAFALNTATDDVLNLVDTTQLLSSQTSDLKTLRKKYVVALKLLCEEKQWFLSILNSVSSRNVEINPMYSQAESTIRSHLPPSTQTQPLKPLVNGTDGKLYPKNPINNYVSRFFDGFSGCLGCGSVSHLFWVCPDKDGKEMKFFVQDLWDHVPSTRKTGTILLFNLTIFLPKS